MITVTGATGHLGNNIVRTLLNNNHKVRALIYPGEDESALAGLAVERAYGNILKIEDLRRAFKDTSAVIHCAGQISILTRCYHQLYPINVAGVRNVVEAGRFCGIKKLIHIASFDAISLDPTGKCVDEGLGFNPAHAMTEYGQTKAEGAQIVLDAVKTYGMDATILTPVTIVGPNDFRPSAMGGVLVDFANGRLPAITTGHLAFVDARDIAQAALNALDSGTRGANYICSSEEMTVTGYMNLLAHITRMPTPLINIPIEAMYHLAWFAEKMYMVLKMEPHFTQGSMALLKNGMCTSNQKTCRELEVAFRPVEETLRDQIEWFSRRGLIKTESRIYKLRSAQYRPLIPGYPAASPAE